MASRARRGRQKLETDDYLERTEVRIERRFDVSPSSLFRAWTEPHEMARWMWASLGRNVWVENDLRVGGAYRIYTNQPGGAAQGEGWSGMCGIYVDIEPGRRLVYTLHWDADVGYNRRGRLALDEVVRVDLEPDGDGTRMVFTQMGIPDDGTSAPTHRLGTEEGFEMLASLVADGRSAAENTPT